MKYKNIFFDLDGTLTDSGPGIRNAVKHALLKYGIEENDKNNLNRFIGPPLYDSFMRYYGISEADARLGEGYFREYYSDKGIFENSVYDGIPECLSALKSAGLSLYIATSKPDFMAKRVLSHFALDGFFESIGGARIEEGICAKKDVIAGLFAENPALSPENTVMVGDREHDVLGALAFGMESIGVLWGYGSENEFRSCGANFIVETPEKLVGLLVG